MGERISDGDLRKLLGQTTKAPWKLSDVRGGNAIEGPSGRTVAAAHEQGLRDAGRQTKANARLIALAPALAAEVLQLRAKNDTNAEMADIWAHKLDAAEDDNRNLRFALERCLNFIENTECELGMTLECGDVARAALTGGQSNG